MNKGTKKRIIHLYIGISIILFSIILYFTIESQFGNYIVTDTKLVPTNTFTGSIGNYKYRGFQLKTNLSKKILVSDGKEYPFDSLNELVSSVNKYYINRFISGITKEAIDFYKQADIDNSLVITWAEIRKFQKDVSNRFNYQNNDTVLNPSEFINLSGGDCDDFVTFTGGMLYYWGIGAYAIILDNSVKNTYHAILGIPADYFDIPSGFNFYDLTNSKREGIPKKRYIIIDYASVGGFSIDYSSDWKFREIIPIYEFISMSY